MELAQDRIQWWAVVISGGEAACFATRELVSSSKILTDDVSAGQTAE
jgi:hypothetical protein